MSPVLLTALRRIDSIAFAKKSIKAADIDCRPSAAWAILCSAQGGVIGLRGGRLSGPPSIIPDASVVTVSAMIPEIPPMTVSPSPANHELRPPWRAPNGVERFFCSLHDQFNGCGRIVFLSRFSGPYEEPAIQRALQRVTLACARARMQVVRLRSGSYEYQPREPFLAPDIEFHPVHDADQGALVAAELGSRSFPAGTEPALRWTVLPADDGTFQVLALAHHALFDGASMAILIRRFLEVLGSDTVPNWKWPEPAVPAASWKTLRRHWTETIRHFSELMPVMRRCQTLPHDSGAAETCVIHRWTAGETAQLMTACRQAETTVTALLGITGLFAARAHYGEDLPVVDLNLPVNLRRFFTPEVAEDTLGLLIAVRGFAIDFQRPVSLREQCQRLARDLRTFVEHEGPLRLIRTANLLIPRRLNLQPGRPPCVSANSLGRITAEPSPSGVRWLECGWFGHGGSHMPAFSQAAAAINGSLTVTSYSNWIGSEHLCELAADVDARLRDFAGVATAAYAEAAEITPVESESPAVSAA